MDYKEKCNLLRKIILDTGGIAIAFSGGTDSSLLAAIAYQELGERALAVTALSPTYSAREQEAAGVTAKEIGINHITITSNELEIPEFTNNPVDRCYYCKKELFDVVSRIAAEHGISKVADGTNFDDLGDYRPGMRAAKECGVFQPLLRAEFTKDNVRQLSRELNLPTADKPAMACLASRFPYGSHITEEKILAVATVENCMRDMGFVNIRVRHHGDIARIEVGKDEIKRVCDAGIRDKIVAAAQLAGFLYVALDLQGYRTGSLNEGHDLI